MKRIRLLELTLENFKGVKKFSLQANGEDVRIFGDNATGKTTLFDGFVWLLFDKDSSNRKDFSIKTLDAAGKTISGLEHTVEGKFDVDGKIITLKKVYYEKWTKKRGSATAEFTGHTTDYFIDGVPSKKKEYEQLISELIDEDIFKLLTNPAYFNKQLKWQDRRKVLLEVAGDVTDDEVIASNSNLSKLPDILQGRTIENHRKIVAARRREINDELEKIPVRIAEVKRNIPNVDGLDKAALEAKISELNKRIDEKQDCISGIRNGQAVAQKQKEIQEVEIELLKIKQAHESGAQDELYRVKARLQEEQSNISILSRELENIQQQIKFNNDNIQQIENHLVQLRQEWMEVNNMQFTHNDECECPTCGQALPEEQVEAAREKALSQFNLEKSKRLEEIDAKGQHGAARKKEFAEQNLQLESKTVSIKKQIEDKQVTTDRLKAHLEQLESQVVDITENKQYVAKLQEKQKLIDELNKIKMSADQSIQEIQMEIIELKTERDRLQMELGQFAVVDQSQARIQELQQQERELAAEFERLEQELYLTEEFIRTKVDLLEEKINSKFKFARFKLFETQINGGLQEVCETLYDGVPYNSGLNNAAKINVGLDIINTLSEHYGFRAPIFIDNAEAVTKLIDIDSQVISLVVSEKDKQLRVEIKENKESVVA